MPASVSEVVPFAFAYAVKWVDFSSSNVTELPAGCFYGSYVEKITLSSKITRLLSDGLPEFDGIPMWARIECYGEYPAVFTCENLSVIENYQGLTELGNGMFLATGLTSFDIGENMVLGQSCFFGCKKLEELNVAEGHPTLSSEDGVLFDKNKQVLLMYPAAKQGLTYTVPASVVEVADCAFQNNAYLTSVDFADDSACVSVGASSFASIATLKTVTLPATLTNIGVSAFFGNTALEKLVFLRGEMPAVADDYGENNWFKYQPERKPRRMGARAVLFRRDHRLPRRQIQKLFRRALRHRSEIAAALDDSKQPEYDFVFDSKGGSQIASVNGFAALTRPVPARDGYFFWGWYLTDGTVSGGVWGEEASFPFWYEGEGTVVTLYARWETERKQDGLSVETGWDFSEQKTITVSQSGIYYFRFTASASGKLASDANNVPLISAELEAAGAEYRVWVMLFSDQSMDYDYLVSIMDRTVKEGHTYFGTLEIDLPAEMFPFTFTANVVINES
ncbi:MAG: leucine-rich repeat protein [Christensenellales bacterium]